jgi:hypothetical protein
VLCSLYAYCIPAALNRADRPWASYNGEQIRLACERVTLIDPCVWEVSHTHGSASVSPATLGINPTPTLYRRDLIGKIQPPISGCFEPSLVTFKYCVLIDVTKVTKFPEFGLLYSQNEPNSPNSLRFEYFV